MTATTVTEAVLNQIANDIHANALNKGFWEAIDPFLTEINTKLNLITTEVSEATTVLRDEYDGAINPYSHMTQEQGDAFMKELADIVIRTLDLGRYFEGVHGNLGEIILTKMTTNTARPRKHGKRF